MLSKIPKMLSEDSRRRMVELITEGLSPMAIAERVGCDVSTVRKAIRELKGYPVPPCRQRKTERRLHKVPLRDLVPAKPAYITRTLKANRLPLIKAAIEKRRTPIAALADVPVVELPALHCAADYAVAEFGSGRVLQTVMTDPDSPSVRVLRLTELRLPHVHSSEITDRLISLRFRNRDSAQSLIDHLQRMMKGFDQ